MKSSIRADGGPLSALRLCWPLQALAWFTVPLFPLACLYILEYMNFGGEAETVRAFTEKHPQSALFGLLVLCFLLLMATLLLRRVWRSALLLWAVSVIFGYVNYMKTALNGDHFMPQDLGMVSQAGELTSFLSGDLPDKFLRWSALLLLWVLLYWLVGTQLPRSAFLRWSAAALAALLLLVNTQTSDQREALLQRFGMTFGDASLQSSNYAANGFVGAFTLNLLSLQVDAPSGYSQQAVRDLLAGYEAVPAGPEGEPFDLVVVLSESFFDARTLPGVTFSEDPLPNYDRLLESGRSRSGKIYTTAIGGGTVRTEFAVLTGLTTDYLPPASTPYWYVDSPLSGYISQLKEAGYTALALHPYDKKFYSRNAAYPLLGFDAFYSQEDIPALTDEVEYRLGHISDATATRAATRLMDQQEGPAVLFLITMECHQPYDPLPEEDIRIQVDAPALSDTALSVLTTYTQGLADADRMLGELADWAESRERPTAIVFFGDHLPTLGPNHLAYNESGYFNTLDGLDRGELKRLYSTPFVIYANRDLEWDMLPQPNGNEISDYNLLNALFRAAGMPRSPYMELLADFQTRVPYYNIRLELPGTPDNEALARAMRLLTYDRVLGEDWSS